MKRHTHTQLIAVLFMVAIGCTSTPTLYGTLESWKGQSIEKAYAAWGRPGTVSATKDKHTYTWVTEVEDARRGTLSCQRTIVTDTERKIIAWSYAGHQGAGCF